MSFSRIAYDTCSYAQKLNENVSHLDYTLDTVKNFHCGECRNELGLVGGNNVSRIEGNMVDLESNLFGIDRATSKCARMKYLPSGESFVQGKSMHKTCDYPKVSTKKNHLKSCQFTSFPAVPAPPPGNLFKCSAAGNGSALA